MKIAVEGCAHGELDKIYEALGELEKENNIKVDLLLICGDFQAVRNRSDLKCMAVPPKYQKLNTFYKYYSGEKTAPVLTIFVGGNHEASNYLSELAYGGWVCPNIYYMGYANVLNVGGLRIAGLSGIYKGQDYLKGHFELPPYTEATKRSAYHIRNLDVFKLKQIKQSVDIFISHDWPRGIYHFGNKSELLRVKPFLKDDILNEKLGSRPAEELLSKLHPSYWFAAHLHCKFAAIVPHESADCKMFTKFLALDKCLPNRKFLQVLDIGDSCTPVISYDPEWLCILRSTNHLLNVTKNNSYMPGPGCSQRYDFSVSEEELQEIKILFNGDFAVPKNFVQTAEPHSQCEVKKSQLVQGFINPQTTKFCENLTLLDPFSILVNGSSKSLSIRDFSYNEDMDITNTSQVSLNPDEISLDDDDDKQSDEPYIVDNNETEDMQNEGDLVGDHVSMNIIHSDFYIDKTGFHSQNDKSIQQEKVTLAERQSLHSQYSSQETVNTPDLLAEFPEFKEKFKVFSSEKSKGNTEVPQSDVSPTKKFKRRNQSMYMTDEN